MAQETLYELYFAQVAGHIVDVRNITYIGPVVNRYEDCCIVEGGETGDEYGFDFETSTSEFGPRLTWGTKEEAEEARKVLVDAHAKLWLPIEQPKQVEEEAVPEPAGAATTEETKEDV